MAYIDPQVSADLTALSSNAGLYVNGIQAKTKLLIHKAQVVVGPATGDFVRMTGSQQTAIITQARTLATR